MLSAVNRLNILCGFPLFSNSKSCPCSKDAICQHFRHFSFLLSTSCILGFQLSSWDPIQQLRIFILFNFRGLNIYPPAFVRGCGFGQIHSCKEDAFERNTVEQGNTGTKYILESIEKQRESCDLESRQCFPFTIGARGGFSFLSELISFRQPLLTADKKGGLCRNLRPPRYFPAYPIGIKLLQGRLKKRQILGARLPKSANRWE